MTVLRCLPKCNLVIRGELSLLEILLSLTGQNVRKNTFLINSSVQEGQVNSFLLPNKSCSMLSPLKEQRRDFLAQSNPVSTDNNFLW